MTHTCKYTATGKDKQTLAHKYTPDAAHACNHPVVTTRAFEQGAIDSIAAAAADSESESSRGGTTTMT